MSEGAEPIEVAVPASPAAIADPESAPLDIPAPPAARPRRRALPWLIVLAILLAAAIAGGVWLYLQLRDANAALDDANDRIQQQQDQIQQQDDQLDKKESFGMAMDRLMTVLKQYDGTPFAAIIPLTEIQAQADAAWQERRSPDAVDSHIAVIVGDTAELQNRLTAAESQRAGNATGTIAESVLDARGDGFVTTAYGDATAECQEPAMGCVYSDEPFTVHLDTEQFAEAGVDDWGRTLVADHEFAHVLQFTNPGPTATAVEAFGGDVEFMADCYALTMLDSWTLTRRVTTSRYIYTTTYGYGRVCDAGQRDVIRTWVSQLGYRYAPIVQG